MNVRAPTQGELARLAPLNTRLRRMPVVHCHNMFPVEDRKDYIRHAYSLGLKNLRSLENSEAGKEAVIIGGGPSVDSYVDNIHRLHWTPRSRVMIAIERMLPWCIKNKVFLDYVIAVDGSEDVGESFAEHMTGVKYLISSACHPSVFTILKKRPVYIFDTHNGDLGEAFWKDDDTHQTTQVNTGSSVVLGALAVAMQLGMRKFQVFGFDCHVTQADYAQGIGGKGGNDPRITATIEGRNFLTTVAYMGFAQQFFIIRQFGKELGLWDSCRIHGDSLVNALGRYEGASTGSH